ncbi:hypothetical protein [Candidatus Electronema sp. JM]|uniref:hypothetical protein n=1 Tax=Candidatus Electronema sp. JM TaxID=3401571 RepID=UPI003AA92E9C
MSSYKRLIPEAQIEKAQPYMRQYKIALKDKNLERDIVAEKKSNDVLEDILQKIDKKSLRMAIFGSPIGDRQSFILVGKCCSLFQKHAKVIKVISQSMISNLAQCIIEK